MRRNATEFQWTKKRLKAAELVADDRMGDADIAVALDINKATLERWKQHPDFRAKVDGLLAVAHAQLVDTGIREKVNRVAALNDRWERMKRIIEERAADEEHARVPGWKTGLLVHQRKQIGGGYNAQVVDEYALDTGLLKEMREHEKQAAQELGQWVERSEVILRREAERIAAETGLPVDDIIQEAERIAAGANGRV